MAASPGRIKPAGAALVRRGIRVHKAASSEAQKAGNAAMHAVRAILTFHDDKENSDDGERS